MLLARQDSTDARRIGGEKRREDASDKLATHQSEECLGPRNSYDPRYVPDMVLSPKEATRLVNTQLIPKRMTAHCLARDNVTSIQNRVWAKDWNRLVFKTINCLRLFFLKQPIRSDCCRKKTIDYNQLLGRAVPRPPN